MNMDMLKEKKYLVAAVIVIVAVLVGGGLLILSKNASSNKQAASPSSSDGQQIVQSLQPSDIGLTLSPITSGKFAGNGVLMSITNISDLTSVDYTLSYTSAGNIPRGVLGHIDINGTPVNQQLPFGTCSDVCHFDQGVTDVKLTLKVVKTDGKAYQVESSYTPPTQ